MSIFFSQKGKQSPRNRFWKDYIMFLGPNCQLLKLCSKGLSFDCYSYLCPYNHALEKAIRSANCMGPALWEFSSQTFKEYRNRVDFLTLMAVADIICGYDIERVKFMKFFCSINLIAILYLSAMNCNKSRSKSRIVCPSTKCIEKSRMKVSKFLVMSCVINCLTPLLPTFVFMTLRCKNNKKVHR